MIRLLPPAPSRFFSVCSSSPSVSRSPAASRLAPRASGVRVAVPFDWNWVELATDAAGPRASRFRLPRAAWLAGWLCASDSLIGRGFSHETRGQEHPYSRRWVRVRSMPLCLSVSWGWLCLWEGVYPVNVGHLLGYLVLQAGSAVVLWYLTHIFMQILLGRRSCFVIVREFAAH